MTGDGEDGAIHDALFARERERRDALVQEDRSLLAGLLADDLVHVHTTGNVHDKTQLLDHAMGFLRFLDVIRSDLRIRVIGPDAAVMTGPMTNVVQRRGVDERIEVRAFVTQVWTRREDGEWRIASFHAVRVPEGQEEEKR